MTTTPSGQGSTTSAQSGPMPSPTSPDAAGGLPPGPDAPIGQQDRPGMQGRSPHAREIRSAGRNANRGSVGGKPTKPRKGDARRSVAKRAAQKATKKAASPKKRGVKKNAGRKVATKAVGMKKAAKAVGTAGKAPKRGAAKGAAARGGVKAPATAAGRGRPVARKAKTLGAQRASPLRKPANPRVSKQQDAAGGRERGTPKTSGAGRAKAPKARAGTGKSSKRNRA